VEPFCASLFDKPQDFVALCIRSVEEAVENSKIRRFEDSKDTVFILSTTKGDRLDLLTPAQRIAAHFGNPNPPIVVSNACTSGVCAQITAMRLLDAGLYENAVVIGCDIQSRFIVSGFQAFKALSPEPCLPFSPDRKGLNLGEAAATIIYSRKSKVESQKPLWTLEAGSIHNDANHITGPSRTGEGSYRCLSDVLTNVSVEEISMIGLHGTGTLYNDEMESIALHRAGLSGTAANSLKGYFGHTLGAAGLLETMLCLHALEQGLILPTKGFERQGTTYPVSVSADVRKTEPRESMQFVKLLSGFGGTNSAVRYKRCNQ
jgi:3-oxoacyl-[acyl-carrier-protein] synthase-1